MKLYSLLNEALSDNKSLMRDLQQKWSLSYDDTKKYVDWFDKTKEKLNPTYVVDVYDAETEKTVKSERPVTSVYKFLRRFTDFTAKELKDITKYSVEQIVWLYNEYNKVPSKVVLNIWTVSPEANPNDKQKLDRLATQTKIDASKQLWHAKSDNLVFESGPIRIYEIRNRQESINFGYYLATFYNQNHDTVRQMSHRAHITSKYYNLGGSPWCITDCRLPNNLYFTYRPSEKYYFLI
jgi:hypothetical protein